MAQSLDGTTTASEAAAVFSHSIKGKTIILTGASVAGLSGEFARAILPHQPKALILAGRTEQKLSELQAQLKELQGAASHVEIKKLIIELGDNASVRQAAASVLSWDSPIDVLINNAGIMAGPYRCSASGHELQFASNYLCAFLFTELILSALFRSAQPRVVNLSSWGHNFSDIRWDDLGFKDGETYDDWQAYGQSKTAQILHAVHISETHADRGLAAFALHPGTALTELGRSLSKEQISVFVDENGNLREGLSGFKSVAQASSTTVVAAFRPDIATHAGSYLEDCQISPVVALKEGQAPDVVNQHKGVRPYAVDKTSAKRLYDLSKGLVGL